MKNLKDLREALEIGTNEIVNAYKKATPGEVSEAPEDNEPASPDEAGMAMDQAKFIGYVADEIMEYIQGNNEFPEWMQNKLSALHEKAKGMHAVMAGKYNESVELEEKYRPATAAEIAADKKKDRAGKPRPSPSLKSIKRKQYGNMMGKLKEESVDEISRSMTPMNKKFGKTVDSKKFDVYKKFVKKNNVDEPTVRMISDNPAAAESKRMMKNKNVAQAVSLYKASMAEAKQHAHIGGVKQADGEDKPVMQGNSKIKEARGIYTVKLKDGSIHKRTLDPQEVMKVKANPNVASVSQVGVAREEVEIDEAKFTDKQIKMAYGILNDPRYKSGNMTAIVKKIEQIAKGLSKHPGVMKAIKVTNENVDERKLTPKEIKRALASAKAKAKPKSQVSLKKAPFEIPEGLEEKLKVSDGMGAWIKDFQKSDAPQFEGKSEKERKEMAIAAYLSAKKEEK
jgi:hypothetical protein